MTAWASLDRDATWLARLTAGVIWPAFFVYLDWPGAEVYASTHHKSLTIGADTWTGVGDAARIDGPNYTRGSALVSYRVGLASLPYDESVDLDLESTAIGRRAILHLGLFDESWGDPKLERVFTGHIRTAGDFKVRRDPKTGERSFEAGLEISNGRNPRRTVANYHSPATAEAGDTALRLLPTAAVAYKWPAG